MKEKSLKEKWRLEQRITDSGKEKRVPVYTGDYYTLTEKREPLWAKGCAGLLIYAACAVLFMKLKLRGTYCLYVLPVFLCGLIPMLYWAMGVFSMRRVPEKMNELDKEKSVGRIMKSALGTAVCSGTALVGDLILLITQKPEKEWIDTLLLALALLSAAAVFGLYKNAYHHLKQQKGNAQA